MYIAVLSEWTILLQILGKDSDVATTLTLPQQQILTRVITISMKLNYENLKKNDDEESTWTRPMMVSFKSLWTTFHTESSIRRMLVQWPQYWSLEASIPRQSKHWTSVVEVLTLAYTTYRDCAQGSLQTLTHASVLTSPGVPLAVQRLVEDVMNTVKLSLLEDDKVPDDDWTGVLWLCQYTDMTLWSVDSKKALQSCLDALEYEQASMEEIETCLQLHFFTLAWEYQNVIHHVKKEKKDNHAVNNDEEDNDKDDIDMQSIVSLREKLEELILLAIQKEETAELAFALYCEVQCLGTSLFSDTEQLHALGAPATSPDLIAAIQEYFEEHHEDKDILLALAKMSLCQVQNKRPAAAVLNQWNEHEDLVKAFSKSLKNTAPIRYLEIQMTLLRQLDREEEDMEDSSIWSKRLSSVWTFGNKKQMVESLRRPFIRFVLEGIRFAMMDDPPHSITFLTLMTPYLSHINEAGLKELLSAFVDYFKAWPEEYQQAHFAKEKAYAPLLAFEGILGNHRGGKVFKRPTPTAAVSASKRSRSIMSSPIEEKEHVSMHDEMEEHEDDDDNMHDEDDGNMHDDENEDDNMHEESEDDMN